MKKCTTIAFGLLLLLATIVPSKAQNNKICRIGFEYQLSYNENWGANKPVILSIEPNSSADKAGLKVGDIVEKINGITTTEMSEQEFVSSLKAVGTTTPDIRLEVSNFGYKLKERVLLSECKDRNLLDEANLAAAFSMYSLEDECERTLIYPFDTGRDPKASFEKIRYFAFADETGKASALDLTLQKLISKQLQSMGLQHNPLEADVIIDTYYTLIHNTYYDKKKASNAKQSDVRYDPDTRSLVFVPVLPVGADKQTAPFVLTMGIRIFDGHGSDMIYWSCEAVEHITEELPLEEYARLSVPMMLTQFPFVRYTINPVFRFAAHKHNYLGVSFHASDLGLVATVAPNSPAARAGIKVGDRIVGINGKAMTTIGELNTAYREFIQKTLTYRDEKTLFTNRQGLKGCRYWDVEDYKAIAKTFAKDKYKTIFAYLFDFRPYITSGNQSAYIEIDILDNEGIIQRRNVLPEIVDNSYITLD